MTKEIRGWFWRKRDENLTAENAENAKGRAGKGNFNRRWTRMDADSAEWEQGKRMKGGVMHGEWVCRNRDARRLASLREKVWWMWGAFTQGRPSGNRANPGLYSQTPLGFPKGVTMYRGAPFGLRFGLD